MIKDVDEVGICLACTNPFESAVKAFCFSCKKPNPLNWTTGNESLDSFIRKSWSNVCVRDLYDSYLQWIEYSRLTNEREISSLRHGCTHIAAWTTNELTRVTLKKIVDEQSDQLFDFHQVN